MSYEVICSGEHSYYVPMCAKTDESPRQPEKEAEKLGKEILDREYKYSEVDLQIKLTCYNANEDGIEPTAEWQRIQDRLKRCDELEAELTTLKERLPKNADGDVVFEGDVQYYWCPFQKRPLEMKVSEAAKLYYETRCRVFLKNISDFHRPFELFSTAESCQASMEGSKTK